MTQTTLFRANWRFQSFSTLPFCPYRRRSLLHWEFFCTMPTLEQDVPPEWMACEYAGCRQLSYKLSAYLIADAAMRHKGLHKGKSWPGASSRRAPTPKTTKDVRRSLVPIIGKGHCAKKEKETKTARICCLHASKLRTIFEMLSPTVNSVWRNSFWCCYQFPCFFSFFFWLAKILNSFLSLLNVVLIQLWKQTICNTSGLWKTKFPLII